MALQTCMGTAAFTPLVVAGAEPSRARVQKHEELVQRSVVRATRLLDDLLDAAAIDSGRLSIERRREDALALAAESSDSFGPILATPDYTRQAPPRRAAHGRGPSTDPTL